MIKTTKLAEALTEKSSRNFWKELNKFQKPNQTVASEIDGQTDPTTIAKTFYSKFKDLYSSVPYNLNEMSALREKIDMQIDAHYDSLLKDGDFITFESIEVCLGKLKPGKNDGNRGLSSDCLSHGPRKLSELLAKLFQMMITHGYCPSELTLGTMTPIPKTKGMAQNSDKYRAITLSCCIGKLFDMTVLMKYEEEMKTNTLQFGFKKFVSAPMCTTILKEVASHYVKNGSHVYCLLLDASKAFDRVEYTRLFNLLLNRKLNVMYIRS